MTIKERQKLARQYKGSTGIKCACCNMPAFSGLKSLVYRVEIYPSGGSSKSFHGKLCKFCFDHPDTSFSYIYDLYTKKGTYPHEDFTEKQLDTMIESLIEEMKVNEKFRSKYLMESREDLLNLLLSPDNI